MKKYKLLRMMTPLLMVLIFSFACGQIDNFGSEPSFPWAKSTIKASGASCFEAMAIDSAGNIYAAGYQQGGDFNYGGTSEDVKGNYNGENAVLVKYNKNGKALWARSATTAPHESHFYAVAIDSAGNIYAAGTQVGDGNFNYGGKDVSGTYSADVNAVIVKYDKTGKTLWAKSTKKAPHRSHFYAVAIDSADNIYAAGYQFQPGYFNYGGTSLDENGAHNGDNAVIVKYDKDGNAIWAKSTKKAPGPSSFFTVTTDSAGNIYTAGNQFGNNNYNYGGTSIDVKGNFNSERNSVLVKYDPNGNALWAKSTAKAPSSSSFYGVTTDSVGNIYVSGSQQGNGNFNYGGTSIDIKGAFNGYNNAVLVKYDDTGNALWARSLTKAPLGTSFNEVTIDSDGYIYVAGNQRGGDYNYGDTSDDIRSSYSGGDNAVIVKYDDTGKVLWAKSTTAATNQSSIHAIMTDSAGNIYTTGYQQGNGNFNYGSEDVSGNFAGGWNSVIVKHIE